MANELNIEKQIDTWLQTLEKKVTVKLTSFVAFLFVLIALTAFITTIVISRSPQFSYVVIGAPILAAILAYYNKAFAVAIFAFLVLVLVFI
jgi:hypothetical protein